MKSFHSGWNLNLLVTNKIPAQGLLRATKQTPRGKRHSGIDVCSAKGNTLKHQVVSGIEQGANIQYSRVDFREFKGINFYVKL